MKWNDVGGLFFEKRSSSNLQFDSLDGLRGIAVLLVVLSHCSILRMNLGGVLDFRGAGRIGVYLFFVLSAFLLTLPFVGRTPSELAQASRWRQYALRRVLRIFPLYGVVIGFHFLGAAYWPGRHLTDLGENGFWQHLTLRAGEGVFWTIPVEFKYYLVLPFVAALFALLRQRTPAILCAVGFLIAISIGVLWPPAASRPGTIALGPYLPIFLVGSTSAFIHARLQIAGGVQSSRARFGLESMSLLAFASAMILLPKSLDALLGGPHGSHNDVHRQYLLLGTIWSLCLLGFLNGRGWIERVLSTRPLRLIGIVSFSVYLWHPPILSLVVRVYRPSSPTLGVLLVVGSSVLAGCVSYLLFERPFLRSAWVQRVVRSV